MNINTVCKRVNSFLLLGFFLIILGSLALTSVFWTTMATVILFGALLVAAGSAIIVHSFWSAEWKGFFTELVVGILSAVVGWLILMNPILGATTLTLLLAVYFSVAGLIKISGAVLHHPEHRVWLLFNGVVTLALGLMILAQWPTASFWIVGMFLAIDLMISGWTSVMLSLALRRTCKIQGQEAA